MNAQQHQRASQTIGHRGIGKILGTRLAPCLLAAIVALSGCESTPYPGSGKTQTNLPATQRSNADALLRLARSASDAEAQSLWLAAAAALYKESRLLDAADALNNVIPGTLSPTDAFDYGALAVELALARYDGPAAKAFFAELQPLNAEQDVTYTTLAKELGALNIDPAAAASTLIASQTPRDPVQQQQRSDQIWALISQSPASTVAQYANTTGGIEAGWWQLKNELLGAFTMTDAAGRLTRWQTSNPLHPASQTPPAQLSSLQNNRPQFSHIALLIPQTGPLAAAGKAVRDGFMAAHFYADKSADGQTSSNQRQISVLDTASSAMPELLRQAEALGADLIVGPLDKNRVAELNQQPQTLPTLLLNYLPDDTVARGDMVQFGLAVEDEAKAIARRIQAEGLERVVVLHNEQEWSLRARDALLREFEAAPLRPEAAISEGTWSHVVGIGSSPDVKQLTSVVGRTLLVDASNARHKRLQRLLGQELEFQPRARQDVDAIVAFLDSPEARALRPALRFHFTSGVPVYTSSQALRRIATRDLRDLRGFNVSEIPWKLYPSPVKKSVEDSFGATQGGLVPLYALGVDAYRLADRLDLLLTTPHQRLLGGTGELSIEYGGRIRRDLAWQFVGSNGLMPLPMIVDR